MAFSFLQIRTLAGAARQLTLARYSPVINLEGLSTGIDNLRTDVYLSHRFADATRHHIAKLIAKYGGIEDFLMLEQSFSPLPPNRFVGPRRSGVSPGAWAKANEPAEFKKLLLDLHVAALNQAKAENNIVLDLLARLAIVKLQRAEMQAQFSQVTERCRAKLKSVDSVRNANPAVAMQERFARFQIGKKSVLRKVGQDFFATLRELEKESLANMRRALFGDTAAASYDLFLNRLLFTEDGRDDLLNAEQYVMLGNFGSDPRA